MNAALKTLLALALLALASALPAEVQHTLQNLERDLNDINYAVVSHEQIHDLDTKLHVSRWGYGELGKSGKHSCRWWKPAGKPVSAGYCSMWDGKSKTDREITESSDCDEGIEMAPLE